MIKNLILVGMPASGKSSVGKILSKKLGFKYIDTDRLIEEKLGSSITYLFENKGEEFFRLKEQETIAQLYAEKNVVIATGGGMPTFFDNMDRLNFLGTTIFLKVPMEELIKRAKRQRQRPLLNTEVETKIKELYLRRIEFYSKANLIIDCENKNKYEICDKIIENLDIKERKFT